MVHKYITQDFVFGFVYYFILSVTVLLQFNHHISGVLDINWLAYLDHDTIYQVERFLLNMNYPNIDRLFSMRIDYGSELYLMAPIFLFLENVFWTNNPINAYYFIIFVHICFVIITMIIIQKTLYTVYNENITACLWLVTVLLLPLFVIYMGFIKPDSNIIFFTIIFCSVLLFNYYYSQKTKIIIIVMLLIGFGTAIKWWPIFLMIPLVYSINNRISTETLKLLVNLNKLSFIGLGIIISGIALSQINSPFLLEMLEYVMDGGFRGDMQNYVPVATKVYNIFINNYYAIQLGLIVFILLLILLYYLITNIFLFKYINSQMESFLLLSIRNFLLLLPIIVFFILVFDLPFLISEEFLPSLYRFALDGFGGNNPLIEKVKLMLQTHYQMGIFSPIIMLLLPAIVYYHFINRKKFVFINILSLSFFPFLLFWILTKAKAAPNAQIAMIAPILFLYIIMVGREFYNNLKSIKQKKVLLSSATLLVFLQVILQNNYFNDLVLKQKFYNNRYVICSVPYFYQYRLNLKEDISNINNELKNIYDNQSFPGKIIFLDRSFPIEDFGYDYSIENYNYKHNTIPMIVNKMNIYDILLITNRQNWMLENQDFLHNNNDLYLIGSLNGPLYKRGIRLDQEFKSFLWQKIQ